VELSSQPVTSTEPPVAPQFPALRTPYSLEPRNLLRRSVTFVVFLIMFAILGLWQGDKFLSQTDRLLDLHQNVPLLLLALGAMSTLIANQFDLSIGSMATLTAYLSVGLVVNQGMPMWLAILCCVLVGAIGGLINAILVVRIGINAFIATLGTSGFFLGISRVYSNGTVLTPDEGSLPSWFTGEGSFGAFTTHTPAIVIWVLIAAVAGFGLTRLYGVLRQPAVPASSKAILGVAAVAAALLTIDLAPSMADEIPLTVVFLLVVATLLSLLLGRTTFGRYLYATGGNPVAARLAGVHVGRETTLAFVITGVLASLGGVVLAANQGSISPEVATPLLLPAFAAAYLSTVLLSTGRFHVWGCILGGLFVIWIRQALIVGGVPFTWAEVINGAVLVAAVAIGRVLSREERAG
jgi:ribose/xylose/arabinose/galactoside ABC-type transport system permease subunit